jgi:micrococcal nuclease
MRRKLGLIVLACLIGFGIVFNTRSQSSQGLAPSEARNHVGEIATVCGEVASTKYSAASRGGPTFINLDKPYPNQVFTVVIWGADRAKFGQPEQAYRGRSICVRGKIKGFRGVPEVVVYEPAQIKVR